MTASEEQIEQFIADWRETGGSELANTQLFINGLTQLLGVDTPRGAKADDTTNDYVFERRVFQDNGDGTQSFGRIDCYKRDCFVLEAKQGSEADRAAAEGGDEDLDLFGQTAKARVARGTARRGTPSWAKAMQEAKGQAERYAKALPTEHGWPPFLLVTDIGYCMEVYADFTGTGKAYSQFPDRAGYRIMLEDLREEEVRERLASIWTDPQSLDPASRSAVVTREIADLLATLSKRLERNHDAETVSGFLMRVLFTMFAEDTEVLLPKDSFKNLLAAHQDNLDNLPMSLTALWKAMDSGEFSPALALQVRKFNGYLFKNTEALALDAEELQVLIEAANKDWTEVEPAIFGTLLERALNSKERAKLGAHYTPRAYVERLIGPTIMEPLRADWNGVRAAASELIGADKAAEAKDLVEGFHSKLAQTRVLDPACGTGNFLYVAMARMKELEGEVLDLLAELGDDQYVAEITGHTITPENFLGIEINPRAAAIAQLVLWIGYLQWHFRVNGKDRAPPEPILKDIRTIENRDALIDYDARVLELDEQGNALTIWDGVSFKEHPVTGKLVPDDTGRKELYRYIKPHATKWPTADFIVGNPPFIGKREMKTQLGEKYVDAVRCSFGLPDNCDFVMYWWHLSAELVKKGKSQRFGLITTSQITGSFNSSIVSDHLLDEQPVSILYAVPDHPWVDNNDGASVRIAMTSVGKGNREGVLRRLEHVRGDGDHKDSAEFESTKGYILSNLMIGPNVRGCQKLSANKLLSAVGYQFNGRGFAVDADEAQKYIKKYKTISKHLKPFVNGNDITQKPRNLWMFDFWGLKETELSVSYPEAYQHLLLHVKPERDVNPRDVRRRNWWIFGEALSTFRPAIEGLKRYIATPITSKHRVFTFLDAPVGGDSNVVMIATDDEYLLGVLSSNIHALWSIQAGTRRGIGNHPRYNKGRCFDSFPFPDDVPEPLKNKIREEAEALDALRKKVLAEHEDLTLTKLYNVLEALRANGGKGRALTDDERDIHDRGLVTLIQQHHDTIDRQVAEAYDWPADLSDEDILTRLVALNKKRAGEEAKGLIRWLRPDYQAPDYQAPVSQTLDLGEVSAPAPDNILPWPNKLPEQVSAVAAVLSSSTLPLAPQDVARTFKGKRAATVRPILDSLTAIGQARRLKDGRYAA
ncbi:DNA methyltransferase [uncultured Erythrobacter sp.]|uniref:class I SAM-dependent DNA methyltransferase n=1 Tax=uncultured Erythrobacter sp. TaxID=263913 RepID=UPI002631FDC0|nr:DNA methyltransferase [uncultured Erythrobacter sp.]